MISPASMPPLLAAGLGPWIPWIVFGVFLVLSLLQRAMTQSRRAERDNPDGWGAPGEPLQEGDEVEGGTVVRRYVRPTPPVLAESPAPRTLTPWEAELERLLRGENPRPPVPAPAPEPPPVYAGPTPWNPLPTAPSVETLVESDLEEAPMPTAPLASLAPAEAAYDSAASLQARVQEYLNRADRAVERASPQRVPSRAIKGAATKGFVEGLRRPATARQAVLASLVLGRPKALEA